MKTKKKKKQRQLAIKIIQLPDSKTNNETIWRQVCNMLHRDIQKACVIRGMEFKSIIHLDHHALLEWLYANWDNTENPNLLLEYDAWFDAELSRDYGIATVRHPSLRFADNSPIESSTTKPIPEPKKEEKPTEEKKTPKVKHADWGINTGTKKYLTYELTITQELELDEVIDQVQEQYPDAEVASIKIWYKRALKFVP